MIAVEVPSPGDNPQRIELHDAITVVAVTTDRRDEIASALSRSLPGSLVVGPADMSSEPSAPMAGAPPEAEAAVATAESAVADASAAMQQAERAYAEVADASIGGNEPESDDAVAAKVAAAEAQLEVARAAAAAARRALVHARDGSDDAAAERSARTAEDQQRLDALQAERASLDTARNELLERLAALGPAADAAAVENALVALRRLRSVKPRPSQRGRDLADRWVAVNSVLASLPPLPSPPDWLVAPALAALQEARAAVARAEAPAAEPLDPAALDAVERAHRELLEAEQRVMKKGSRTNQRRLEQAAEAERAALAAVGVASYSEYLEQLAPGASSGASAEERAQQARAALADAEAVWEELHGGAASREYAAAKQEQAEVRQAAHELLGEEVDDAQLEVRLREHLEAVVDTEWAVDQLLEALRRAGVDADAGEDVEATAQAWLADAPERLEARRKLEELLARVDERVKEVDEVLATQRTEAFSETEAPADLLRELTEALEEAEAAERAASEALAREQDATAARAAVDDAKTRLASAEEALRAAQAASKEAADAARAAEAAQAASTASVGGLATTAWLLARVAAARAASEDAPLVVDGRVVTAASVLRLLDRVAGGGRVVVLGDEQTVTSWAAGLGDRAVIRTI